MGNDLCTSVSQEGKRQESGKEEEQQGSGRSREQSESRCKSKEEEAGSLQDKALTLGAMAMNCPVPTDAGRGANPLQVSRSEFLVLELLLTFLTGTWA